MELQKELVKAAGRGDKDKVLRLMSQGAEIRESGTLCKAVYHGQADMVRFLISHGADVEEIEPKNSFSVLIYAIEQGRKDVLEALLDSGANVNQSNVFGTTPLHNAIEYDKPEIAAILLKHGANVNATYYSSLDTPLHDACYYGNYEMVKLLIAVPGIEINAMNEFFETPLHVASEKKNKELVLLLLHNGADPDLRDENGKTAFDLCSDFSPVLAEMIKSFQLKRKELETKNKELKKMLEESNKRQVELEKKQLKRKEDSEDGEKMEGGDEMKIFEEVVDRLKEFERKLDTRLDGIESLYKETEQFRASQLRLEDSMRDVKDRLSQLEASFRRVDMSENNRPLRGARREPKPIKCGSSVNSRIKAGEKRPPTTTIGKALFVSWLAHDLLSDDLRDALVEDEGIASAVCVRLRTKNPDATHSSFYVSCKDESDYERLSDPSIWPVNCVIGEFRGPLRDHLKHRSELEARH